MRNLTITPKGNMLVAEGVARARWKRRADGSWKLAGIWPDEDERAVLQHRLQQGAGLLVVLEPAASILSAFRDEVDDPDLLAAAEPGDSIIDVAVPFLDWLPAGFAQRGRQFQHQVHDQAAALPAALQPAIILEEPAEAEGMIRFAARTPGAAHRLVTDEQLCSVADYAFSGCPAKGTDEARRPGSITWLARLARMVVPAPREHSETLSGAGHGL